MSFSFLYSDLLLILLPASLRDFSLVSVSESPSCIVLRLEESVNNIPTALKDMPNIVLDDFCNSLELQTFPLNDKPVYFKIYRRRWKVSCDNKHHSNRHDLHPLGVKATFEFANFLKEEVGQTLDEYNACWRFASCSEQEVVALVSR